MRDEGGRDVDTARPQARKQARGLRQHGASGAAADSVRQIFVVGVGGREGQRRRGAHTNRAQDAAGPQKRKGERKGCGRTNALDHCCGAARRTRRRAHGVDDVGIVARADLVKASAELRLN